MQQLSGVLNKKMEVIEKSSDSTSSKTTETRRTSMSASSGAVSTTSKTTTTYVETINTGGTVVLQRQEIVVEEQQQLEQPKVRTHSHCLLSYSTCFFILHYEICLSCMGGQNEVIYLHKTQNLRKKAPFNKSCLFQSCYWWRLRY